MARRQNENAWPKIKIRYKSIDSHYFIDSLYNMGNQKTKPDAVTKYKPLSQEPLIAIFGIAATCFTALAIAAMN